MTLLAMPGVRTEHSFVHRRGGRGERMRMDEARAERGLFKKISILISSDGSTANRERFLS